MIQLTTEQMSKWEYPMSIYYYEASPYLRKLISDIVPPSQELYDCMMGNFMTLGRPVPTFFEYVDGYMLAEVARLVQKINR